MIQHEWFTFRERPYPIDETVFIIDGIHGNALARWNERQHLWQFKHYRVCWWEATPYPMSITRWRLPKQPIIFGHSADLYEGPAFDSIP